MKRKIEGIVYFDIGAKRFDFGAGWDKDWFVDGVWSSCGGGYSFIAEHTINIELPDDFDIIAPQLQFLDAKEKELTLQYNQAIKQIKCERNSLLAIEG